MPERIDMSTPVPQERPGPLVFTASYEGVTNTFRIAFVHSPVSPTHRRVTWCVIDQYVTPKDHEIPNARVQVAQGTSVCSHKDLFVKETGRRIALRRACKQLCAEISAAALHAYFSRSRGKVQRPVEIEPIKPQDRPPVDGEPSSQCPVCDSWYVYPYQGHCYPGWCETRRLAFRRVPS